MTSRRQKVIIGRQWGRWNSGDDITALAAASVARIEITTLILADLPSLSNWTVLRSLGELTLSNSAATYARVAYGLLIVPSSVTIAGTPDLVDEPHADWAFWGSVLVHPTAYPPRSITWDIRAMRRGRELEQRIWFVIRNQHAADSINFSAAGAVLLGLH